METHSSSQTLSTAYAGANEGFPHFIRKDSVRDADRGRLHVNDDVDARSNTREVFPENLAEDPLHAIPIHRTLRHLQSRHNADARDGKLIPRDAHGEVRRMNGSPAGDPFKITLGGKTVRA